MHISNAYSGKRYTKRFNAWMLLVMMLYVVIKRLDSWCEITVHLLTEEPKRHLGIPTMGSELPF